MIFLHIGLGIIAVVLLVRILLAVLPIIQAHCAAAINWLDDRQRAFRWGGELISHQGLLTPGEQISQVAGAVLMMGALMVFVVSEAMLIYSVIGPMFGQKVDLTKGVFASLHQLSGLSVILLATVFGIVLTDLMTWTALTRFAECVGGIERGGRAGAFLVSGLCFLGSLVLAFAMAVYRVGVLTLVSMAPPAVGGMTQAPAVILITLGILLVFGAWFTVINAETFLHALCALLSAVVGTFLVALRIMLTIVALAAELLLACLGAVMPSHSQSSGTMRTVLARLGRSLGACSQAVSRKVNTLVYPHAPVGRRANGTSAFPIPDLDATLRDIRPSDPATRNHSPLP